MSEREAIARAFLTMFRILDTTHQQRVLRRLRAGMNAAEWRAFACTLHATQIEFHGASTPIDSHILQPEQPSNS